MRGFDEWIRCHISKVRVHAHLRHSTGWPICFGKGLCWHQIQSSVTGLGHRINLLLNATSDSESTYLFPKADGPPCTFCSTNVDVDSLGALKSWEGLKQASNIYRISSWITTRTRRTCRCPRPALGRRRGGTSWRSSTCPWAHLRTASWTGTWTERDSRALSSHRVSQLVKS